MIDEFYSRKDQMKCEEKQWELIKCDLKDLHCHQNTHRPNAAAWLPCLS